MSTVKQTPSPFLRGLAESVIRHRRAIIVVIALITAVLGFFAAKQKVIINPATVVPQSHRYIQATNEVERVFGSKYLVVIGKARRSSLWCSTRSNA